MSGDMRDDLLALLDRLSRRGVLTITAEDGSYELSFKSHGPYHHRSFCTTDEADLYEHCDLGAKSWQGDSQDFVALLVRCEMESRPANIDVDDLVWRIERRRESRTHGPPLPLYLRWDGWSPGIGRWLSASTHQSEYLGGYLQYGLAAERKFEAEQAESRRRTTQRERDRVRRVLEGSS